MRIVIDARWIFPRLSGIGVYTRELIRHLVALDRDNEYVLLFDDADARRRTLAETGIAGLANVDTVLLPYGVFSPAGQILLPTRLRSLAADIYHSTNYMIPFAAFPRRRAGRTKCVATVHDVIPLLFPAHAPRSRKSRVFPLYRRLMIEVGRRADALITDSLASRKDVIECLRIPASGAGRVHAVYCGVSGRFRPGSPEARSAGANRGALLYVGRSDPYKNVAGLIRIFARVRAAAGSAVTLTVAGSRDPRYPEAAQLAAELGVDGSVCWTGYLSDERLAALYREADVLVHPSRYEGFGLQVAEAMASGLPVVCSNAGSLPEVAGDAALQHDPDDEDGFVESIQQVLRRPELAREMREKGICRAAQFTWKRTAVETLRVYGSING